MTFDPFADLPTEQADPFEENAEMPKGTLSPSSIATYMKCPEQYRREQIKGEQRGRGAWAVSGAAFHNARHKALEWQRDNEVELPEALMQPIYEHAWLGAIGEGNTAWGKYKPEIVKAAGWEMFALYQRELGRTVFPVSIESWVRGYVDGVPVPVVGRIDVMTAEEVIDTKTGRQLFHQIKPEHYIQGCVYTLLTGLPIQWHSVSEKPATDGGPLLRLEPRPKVLEAGERYVRDAYDGIRHNLRTRGPDAHWPVYGPASGTCRYCSFKFSCPGMPD